MADGFNYPRPEDTFFDVTVRVPRLPAVTTLEQLAFTVPDNVKGGWIRKLGYSFNSPQGFFQVRTFLLLNGATPSNYIFQTVDASAPDAAPYQGSMPTVQLGAIEDPFDVYIQVPGSGTQISVRFVNNSTVVPFSCALRFVGWYFSG